MDKSSLKHYAYPAFNCDLNFSSPKDFCIAASSLTLAAAATSAFSAEDLSKKASNSLIWTRVLSFSSLYSSSVRSPLASSRSSSYETSTSSRSVMFFVKFYISFSKQIKNLLYIYSITNN